jgi:hypothetical protein
MSGTIVVNGATLQCALGGAPSTLVVPPVREVTVSSQPVATIMDFQPMVNIMPFAMCMSPANPQVIAATAAALGVFTPQPCVPATVSPWAPGSPTVMVADQPVLTNISTCECMWGGVISVTANPNTTALA